MPFPPDPSKTIQTSKSASAPQGKRGIEKPPFQLPDFIEATGIGAMRSAYHEKEEGKKLKQKSRERVQPKMGRMDIDYQARLSLNVTFLRIICFFACM